MKGDPILRSLKQKDIFGYNLRYFMSSVLVFYDIIMNIIRNNILECHEEGVDFFLKIENKIIYMYRRSLQNFYWKKGTCESLYVPCVHFNVERIQMRQYLIHILKCDTSSDDINTKIDRRLDSFERFHKKYIIMPTESYNSSLPE